MNVSDWNVLEAEVVMEQVSRILSSKTFSRADYLCRFLRICVEETLKGNGGQLKELWIGRMVFDRKGDFNPAQSPIVRVQAGRLREKLARYYEAEGRFDPVRISFPSGSYIPLVSIAFYKTDLVSESDRWVPVVMLPLTSLETNEAFPLTETLSAGLKRALMDLGNLDILQPAAGLDTGEGVGARYVVAGTVATLPDSYRVSLHLADAQTGDRLWSAWFEQRQTRTHPDVHRIVKTLAAELGRDTFGKRTGAVPAPHVLHVKAMAQSTSANPRFM